MFDSQSSVEFDEFLIYELSAIVGYDSVHYL